MKRAFGKTIVIALGGSVVYPGEIDTEFLRQFKTFIFKFIRRKRRFVIVVGGGRIARLFQAAAHKVGRITDEDKDWLGIHATRLNAHLLRTIFRAVADPVVIDKRFRIRNLRFKVTIASGWRPGWSTDYVAAVLAKDFGVEEFIIAGKPAFVYDKDPHKHDGARPIYELSWKEYRRLVPRKWKPGLHSPVDPVAAEFSAKHGLRAVVLNGKNLKNLEALLNNKKFRGTIIR
jgi:uridylate kinase